MNRSSEVGMQIQLIPTVCFGWSMARCGAWHFFGLPIELGYHQTSRGDEWLSCLKREEKKIEKYNHEVLLDIDGSKPFLISLV